MRITDLLSKDGIELNVNAKDKNDIINKMTKLMLKTGRITDLNAYTELVLKREEEIVKAIQKEIETKNLSLFVFAITDILNSNSEIIALGEKANVTETAFSKKLENNKMFLEGVVSRKKQLLPAIDKNI